MKYEAVIGLEIHIETRTKTKMFSSSPVDFKAKPNMNVLPLDLGHPGTLPVVNKQAVRNAIILCKALNMDIDKLIRFDRKNYFYSDLPKGFQITQDLYPIGKNGHISLKLDDGSSFEVRIQRLHMEEDTAKQLHLNDSTLIDYNRAGVPLVELVTHPDIRNGKQAAKFVETIREIVTFTDVSDGKMEEGSLRCDVNISLREVDTTKFGTKVEIKNLNSISNVEKVIDIEIARQSSILDSNGIIQQETRRYDDVNNTTVLMRLKTDAVDYKYFPEANIAPIQINDKFIEETMQNAKELPDVKRNRYQNEFKLPEFDINILMSNKDLAQYFDSATKHSKNHKTLVNLLLSEVLAYVNRENSEISSLILQPLNLANLVNMIEEGKISNKQAREILSNIITTNKDPNIVAKELNLVQVSDDSAIRTVVNEVLDANIEAVNDIKNGKDRAFGFLVGMCMKKGQGKFNPALVSSIVKEEINKR